MTLPAYRPWMNIVLYQGIWFGAVLGRERLAPWLLLPLALHILLCRQRGRELALIGACTAIGCATDAALTAAGVFAFAPSAPGPLPIPFWLVVIWLGFAATLRHALAWFVARAPLAIAAAALGAPLSYLAAARLGAVALPHGQLRTALLLAVIWAVLMATFVAIARALERPSSSSAPAAASPPTG